MKYCEQCGKPMADNDLFCQACGSKHSIPVMHKYAVQTYASQETPKKPSNSSRRSGLNIACILILVACILVLLFAPFIEARALFPSIPSMMDILVEFQNLDFKPMALGVAIITMIGLLLSLVFFCCKQARSGLFTSIFTIVWLLYAILYYSQWLWHEQTILLDSFGVGFWLVFISLLVVIALSAFSKEASHNFPGTSNI